MPTTYVYANFWVAELLAGVAADGETLEVSPSLTGLLPLFDISDDTEARLTLWDGTNAPEIVAVEENPQTGFLAVRRGEEDTTPIAWAAGTQVRCAITAEVLDAIMEASVDPVAALAGSYLALTGGTMTGALVLLAASPTLDNHAARKKYVDDLIGALLAKAGGTMSGDINMNSVGRLLGLLTPLVDSEPATKAYADLITTALTRFKSNTAGAILTTGGGTAYVAATSGANLATLADGDQITVKFHASSGASPTLNVDGSGAKAIAVDLIGSVPPTGYFLKNNIYSFTYDLATTKWIAQNINRLSSPSRPTTGGTSTALTLTTGHSIPTPEEGTFVKGILHVASGATVTLAVDGGSAYPLRRVAGVEIKASELPIKLAFDARFSAAASEWVLVNAPAVGIQDLRDVSTSSLVNGQGLFWNGTAFVNSKNSPRGYIDGCTIANGDGAGGGDQTNDITFSAGTCRDSTDTVDIICPVRTKQLDANWVVGTNQGMRNSAAGIANTTYHLWAVMTAAGTVDYYAHTSAVAATVLAALQAETGGALYIYARHIASIVRAGATILAFTQDQDEFHLATPVADIVNATPNTTANTGTLASVPAGVRVKAFLNTRLADASGMLYVSALNDTDLAPSLTAAPLGNGGNQVSQASVWTNTSAQVRYRASSNNAAYIVTLGWKHSRGKNA